MALGITEFLSALWSRLDASVIFPVVSAKKSAKQKKVKHEWFAVRMVALCVRCAVIIIALLVCCCHCVAEVKTQISVFAIRCGDVLRLKLDVVYTCSKKFIHAFKMRFLSAVEFSDFSVYFRRTAMSEEKKQENGMGQVALIYLNYFYYVRVSTCAF